MSKIANIEKLVEKVNYCCVNYDQASFVKINEKYRKPQQKLQGVPILSAVWRRLALYLDYSNIYDESASRGATVKPQIKGLLEADSDFSQSDGDDGGEKAPHSFHNVPLGQQ